MQTPFHSSTPIYAVVIALLLMSACQPQGGQALQADEKQWLHYATEACHRNDQRAFETLIARAGDTGEGVACVDATLHQATTTGEE